jgi:hypothetical protein
MSDFGWNEYSAMRNGVSTPYNNKNENNMKTKIECIFCNYVADNLNDLKEHSAKCEKHPLWQDYAEDLKKQLDERCQQLANYDYEHWDDLRDANALIDTMKQMVPEKAAGWCYDCSTVVETYHYGGSGNPQCIKCRSSKTDDLSSMMEEYITKLQSILYKKET